MTFTLVKKRGRVARMARGLYLDFRAEIKTHGDENPVEPAVDFRRRVQGGRHFELLRVGKKKVPAGFAQYAVNETDGGMEPDGGAFLVYYIAPAYRGKGYGRCMFQHCAEVLRRDGAKYLYCCPDPVTGEPFWRAMGFIDSGVLNPGYGLNIFIKREF